MLSFITRRCSVWARTVLYANNAWHGWNAARSIFVERACMHGMMFSYAAVAYLPVALLLLMLLESPLISYWQIQDKALRHRGQQTCAAPLNQRHRHILRTLAHVSALQRRPLRWVAADRRNAWRYREQMASRGGDIARGGS